MPRLQLMTVLLCCLPLAGLSKTHNNTASSYTTKMMQYSDKSATNKLIKHFLLLRSRSAMTYETCLRCYTCVFPAISPLDCLRFPQECSAGQRCLSSTATGRRGSLELTMYEKSCAVAAQCGLSGQKYASGLYFNYTNVCCDTDLCNGATSGAALSWGRAAACLLPALALLLA
ncbi:putative prostate stem cell antigen-like [Scophthalmus maximus]|uniref:Putative prostate stem cell antigen-like n=1 Tax=Scophthalmus maximus TaxID=52904 RepID=A0A2U9CZA9_SCOMX|nr:putative prostate stem cell antigen-like [Scophthalmus maximus]